MKSDIQNTMYGVAPLLTPEAAFLLARIFLTFASDFAVGAEVFEVFFVAIGVSWCQQDLVVTWACGGSGKKSQYKLSLLRTVNPSQTVRRLTFRGRCSFASCHVGGQL